MKILAGGKRKGKLGLPLGTGKASGDWTQNFLRQWPCSKQARAESSDQHGRKSIRNQPSRVESQNRRLVDKVDRVDRQNSLVDRCVRLDQLRGLKSTSKLSILLLINIALC